MSTINYNSIIIFVYSFLSHSFHSIPQSLLTQEEQEMKLKKKNVAHPKSTEGPVQNRPNEHEADQNACQTQNDITRSNANIVLGHGQERVQRAYDVQCSMNSVGPSSAVPFNIARLIDYNDERKNVSETAGVYPTYNSLSR